ncbi:MULTISPECIES: 4-oxalocrotonate tautomerase DmpI [Methanobrevibacter]|uniref:4-oxalocrotonate tautomerase n=1 Tax=Methanobrevibacter gottschalkii DSM 11977 TaxID=1122229 RepID=A0A3N5BTF0_9EURY|nr:MULTISPECIES: 4-oxalocrotonate tautomerase DmpI [Methanobrevibacter]OEC99201.1 4-oxalocrotonate tautomerase [Methanobrevibacter sp. A27]RPF53038.1 4-oxalocrotonate tautomerase [Methanobrevibacter gottschalkii DSM 11977]
MPVITIAGNKGITIEKKREMVKKVSEVVSEAYGLPIEAITVLIQEYDFDDIGVAGELLSDRK